jgi:hypothetical protein
VLTTVGFQALQFHTAKKLFVATRKVPKAVIHLKTELTLDFQSLMKNQSFGKKARILSLTVSCAAHSVGSVALTVK